MKRREFITLLGGAAAAWPLAARAQQPTKLPTIGYLGGATPRVAARGTCAAGERVRRLAAMMGGRNADTDLEGRAWFAAFRQALQELGWVEGHNFRADYRWPSGDLDRMQAIAKEFVDLKPDVMFAGNTPSVVALLRETRTIPIVFANLADPVGTGVVGSLARPGGNATGFTGYEYSLAGKWLQMLKEIAPAVTRVALLFNPETAPFAQHYLTFIEASAPAFGMTANAASIRSVSEIEATIEAQARAPGGGLVVLPDSFTFNNRAPLIASAARHRLPAVYGLRGQALDGGLLSYGPDTVDLYRRAAAYVHRILKGEKPADLPVQNPTKYELVINLKTARALGLEVPPTLLARADEVRRREFITLLGGAAAAEGTIHHARGAVSARKRTVCAGVSPSVPAAYHPRAAPRASSPAFPGCPGRPAAGSATRKTCCGGDCGIVRLIMPVQARRPPLF